MSGQESELVCYYKPNYPIAYDYVGSVIERAAGCKAFTRAITKEAIASENNTANCGLWIHHMGSSQRVQAGGTAS